MLVLTSFDFENSGNPFVLKDKKTTSGIRKLIWADDM